MKFRKYLNENKSLQKGIFWIVDLDNIDNNSKYCFTIDSDINGNPLCDPELLNSKNGETYNHEKTWNQLDKKYTFNKKYNYFPRGRVEINRGKATIYLNPNINTDEVIDFIIDNFHLTERNGITNIKIVSDGSDHYKCYLDN